MQGSEKSVSCYQKPWPSTVESTERFSHLLSAELTTVSPADLSATGTSGESETLYKTCSAKPVLAGLMAWPASLTANLVVFCIISNCVAEKRSVVKTRVTWPRTSRKPRRVIRPNTVGDACTQRTDPQRLYRDLRPLRRPGRLPGMPLPLPFGTEALTRSPAPGSVGC